MNTPIYTQLLNLKKESRIPFHMPGHKRKGSEIFSEISSIDITEINGYDDLHHPEGIIRASMDELKKIYHTKESWYLINGSTVGILAAVSSCCNRGDGILMSRNCHKSVYNAVRLLHLHAYYFQFDENKKYDMIQGINLSQKEEIKQLLSRHKEIKAVIFPSPTYEGVVLDIKSIKEITQEAGVPLIVDEAHGAHFIFHQYFPKSAVECGADIVIQSTHKTLPAMTQTALLHLCSNKVSAQKISDMLSIYESSSPSYVLMASAEYAVAYMEENVDKIKEYVNNLHNFRKKCGQLRCIHLVEKNDIYCFDYDCSKLVFSVKNSGINGNQLSLILLEKYGIETEMADSFHCIAMTSVCDKKEDYHQLFAALKEIDEKLSEKKNISSIGKTVSGKKNNNKITEKYIPQKIMESWECYNFEVEEINIEEANEKIAAEYIILYPPGIPMLVPGEKIVKETVENIRYYLYNGYNVLGLSGRKIKILKK